MVFPRKSIGLELCSLISSGPVATRNDEGGQPQRETIKATSRSMHVFSSFSLRFLKYTGICRNDKNAEWRIVPSISIIRRYYVFVQSQLSSFARYIFGGIWGVQHHTAAWMTNEYLTSRLTQVGTSNNVKATEEGVDERQWGKPNKTDNENAFISRLARATYTRMTHLFR